MEREMRREMIIKRISRRKGERSKWEGGEEGRGGEDRCNKEGKMGDKERVIKRE